MSLVENANRHVRNEIRRAKASDIPAWAEVPPRHTLAHNATPADALTDHYQMVPHDKLHRWEAQPRRMFAPEEIVSLRDEILNNRINGSGGLEKSGIEQPLVVCPHPELADHYLIIEGERRWRATEGTAVSDLPCIVRAVTQPGEMLEIALAIGINRENWSPVDEGLALQRWMAGENQDGTKISVRKAAERLGKDKGYVENRLRLATASEDVQRMVSLRKDTVSHAYHIMQIENEGVRRRFIRDAENGASVATIRDAVYKMLDRPLPPPKVKEPEIPVLPVNPSQGTVPLSDYTPSHHQPTLDLAQRRSTPNELPEITLAAIAGKMEEIAPLFEGGMKSGQFVKGVRRDLERIKRAVEVIEKGLEK